MIVSLPKLAIAAGVTRRVELAEIVPTKVQENELLSIYMDLVRVWRAGIVNELLPAFSQESPIVTDASIDKYNSIIAKIAEDAERTLIYQTPKLGRWVRRVGDWNGEKIISASKSATGVEIRPYMRLIDIQDQLDVSIRANVAMMKSINAATRERIEYIMADSIVNRRNKKFVTKALAEALGISQRRARRVATDQLHKLNANLVAIRNQELGISKFQWVTRGDEKVRHLHRTYNRKIYRWDKPPSDGLPGWPINCRCSARAVFGDDDDG